MRISCSWCVAAQAQAFELVYDATRSRVLARLSDDGTRKTRGRGPGGVLELVAVRRALRPQPRVGPHLGPRHRPQPRDRRPARAERHDRRAATRGSRSASRAGERTDVEAARREEAATVRQALEHLPAKQRKVIELAYFGGFTHTEIARCSRRRRDVKGRMRLGLEKLRAALGERAGEPMSARPRWADDVAPTCLARCRPTSSSVRGAPRRVRGVPAESPSFGSPHTLPMAPCRSTRRLRCGPVMAIVERRPSCSPRRAQRRRRPAARRRGRRRRVARPRPRARRGRALLAGGAAGVMSRGGRRHADRRGPRRPARRDAASWRSRTTGRSSCASMPPRRGPGLAGLAEAAGRSPSHRRAVRSTQRATATPSRCARLARRRRGGPRHRRADGRLARRRPRTPVISRRARLTRALNIPLLASAARWRPATATPSARPASRARLRPSICPAA